MTRYPQLQEELRRAPRTWVVTGAAGFIGSNLVEALLRLDQNVVGLDDLSAGTRRNLAEAATAPGTGGSFRFLEADVCDYDACMAACKGADYVLHQAALTSVPQSMEDPSGTLQVNVAGTLNVVLAARARGVRRMVFASSSAVYGDSPVLPAREGTVGVALSPYGLSKAMDEQIAALYARIGRLESVGLRYFNVFGPRQDPRSAYAAVIPNWTATLLAGGRCTVHGDGLATRDFVPVGDVVQANLLGAAGGPLPEPARVYNVGTGRSTSLRELWTLLAGAVRRASPGTHVAPCAHGPARDGDIRHSQADISRIRAELGFEPPADLAAALAETVSWYAARAPRPEPLAMTEECVSA
jgi:UDP-N-acetylglucosamine 4-epimerase